MQLISDFWTKTCMSTVIIGSLTQLSETEHKEQNKTIKQNFIEYLIAHAHERQVIIVEQTKRIPFTTTESVEDGIHIIQFSRNREECRFDKHDLAEKSGLFK